MGTTANPTSEVFPVPNKELSIGNIIESNRKAGIKLSENATAQIGGTTQDDILILPKNIKNQTPEEKEASKEQQQKL